MNFLLKQDFKLSHTDGGVAFAWTSGSDMTNLLQMLGEAEKIASEGIYDEIEADESFTPSIFDIPSTFHVKAPITTQPAHATHSEFRYSLQEDPFEPTPIGPCIQVVNEIPVTSPLRFQTSAEKPCGDAPDKEKPQPDPKPILQACPRAVSASPINGNRKFRDNQWNVRFQDLLDFQQKHGHLLVPHAYSKNPKLSQWVKR